MIRKISFSNFYSFKEKNTIDFTTPSRKTANLSYIPTCDQKMVSKIYTVVGANASGKTNFLRSFGFVGWFALHSFLQQQENQEIPCKPYLLNFHNPKKSVTEFSIEFEEKNTIYRYEFSLTPTKVLKETLKQVYPLKKSYFSRYQYNHQAKYQIDNLNVPLEIIKNNIKPNASLASLILTFPDNNIKNIFRNFEAFSNVKEVGYVDPRNRLESTLKKLSSEPQKLKKIVSLINNSDICLSGIEIKSDSQGKYIHTSSGIHTLKNNRGEQESATIPLIYESSGTKYLIPTFDIIVDSLSTGITAVIDEIDNNLHPLLIPTIVNLFINPETNPKNSQLIISTHNAEILNYLNKFQVIITQKNRSEISRVIKLSRVKGIKANDNLLKKYLSGTYGGIPNT